MPSPSHSPAQYWVSSTNHLAPRYAISSIPQLPRRSYVQIFSSTPCSVLKHSQLPFLPQCQRTSFNIEILVMMDSRSGRNMWSISSKHIWEIVQLVGFYYKNKKSSLFGLYISSHWKFSFHGGLAPEIVQPCLRAQCNTALSSITGHCMLLTSAHSTQYQISAIFFNGFGYSNAEATPPPSIVYLCKDAKITNLAIDRLVQRRTAEYSLQCSAFTKLPTDSTAASYAVGHGFEPHSADRIYQMACFAILFSVSTK